MTQRVLVTGASGFVGGALVSLLLSQQWQVRVLTRTRGRLASQPWRHQVEIVSGDLRNEDTCRAVVQDVDAVVHLAGLAHVGASAAQHRQENFQNTLNLAQAAREGGVRRLVYVSSCKARYPGHSAYGYYKEQSEQHLLATKADLPVVCLRPGIIYGAGMQNNLRTLLNLLSRPQMLLAVQSRQVLSMIALEDCCHAIAAALQHPALPGRVWELTDGVAYTLSALVHEVRQQLALPPPLLTVPQWLAANAPVKLLAGIASLLPPLRRRGIGISTYQALFEEYYPVALTFADITGLPPTTTLYAQLPTLLHPRKMVSESPSCE